MWREADGPSGLIGARASDKDNAMRVGISLTSNHPDAKDPRQGACWMIERAAAARRAGLTRCLSAISTCRPRPIIKIRRCSGGFSLSGARLRPGVCSCSPCGTRCWWRSKSGRWPPSRQAASSCNAGSSYGEARFAAMGANIKTRPSAFEEALDIIRRLLAGEAVSSARRFRVAQASLALRPAELVEVWIGASESRRRRRRRVHQPSLPSKRKRSARNRFTHARASCCYPRLFRFASRNRPMVANIFLLT